jgi:hypothetical protein
VIVIGGYPIDVALSEEHKRSADVTEHAVEKGSDLSDNIRVKQREITIEGVVTDTPIGAIALDPTRQNVDGMISQDAYRQLEALFDSGDTFTLICARGKFENMAFVDLSEPIDKDHPIKGLYFTGTFRQIRTATLNRITVRVAIPIAGGKADLGNKLTSDWKEKFQVPQEAILVTVWPGAQRATLTKTLGPVLFTIAGSNRDCYRLVGGQIAQGYLEPNGPSSPGTGPSDAYTFFPLNVGSGPQNAVAQDANEAVPPKPASDEPIHYNYARKRWEDKNGNAVTQNTPSPAPGNDVQHTSGLPNWDKIKGLP